MEPGNLCKADGGSASNLGPLCPSSDWEGGRKKFLIFLCRSTLSNLSNLFKEFIEKGVSPTHPLRLVLKRADTLASLDRTNNDEHFSRPTSDRKVGRG